MAIIKFLSDVNCNIMIDHTISIMIIANNITQVQLESGSYWIEVYNCYGDVFKKYELYVNPNLSQILQRISLFDIVTEHSLHPHNFNGKSRFIPVYLNDGIDRKYGFLDWSGKIVVPLYFDDAWYTTNEIPMVSRFGRDIEILDDHGNIVYFPFSEYDGLDIYQGSLPECPAKVAHKNNQWGFLPDEGFDNINDPLINSCDKIILFDDYYGIVVRKGGKCIFQYYDHSNGSIGVEKTISFEVDWYIPRYLRWDSPHPENVSIYRKNLLYGFISLDSKVLTEPRYDGVYYDDSNGKINAIDEFVIVKRDGKCAIAEIKDDCGCHLLTLVEYDHISRTPNPDDSMYNWFQSCNHSWDCFLWIVKKGEYYGCVNDMGEIVIPIVYRLVSCDKVVFAFDELGSTYRHIKCEDESGTIIRYMVKSYIEFDKRFMEIEQID